MPWKASSVMEEKIQFVLEYEQDNYAMSGLRHCCGITRDTVYVWLRRYRDRGGGRVGGVEPGLGSRDATPPVSTVTSSGLCRCPRRKISISSKGTLLLPYTRSPRGIDRIKVGKMMRSRATME